MSEIEYPGRVEQVATKASDGISWMLRRLASLVFGAATVAFVIGLATFATGWWLFHGSVNWIVLGGAICAIPVLAALWGALIVRRTARLTPRFATELRSFVSGKHSAAVQTLIDHDSGQRIGMAARSFGGLRQELSTRRSEVPALYAGIKAITNVPGLAAIAALGTMAVGALGTILLIAKLVS